MVKVKVTINAKPKRTVQLQITSRADLVTKIQQNFNIDPVSIVIMKPQIKDQEQFNKNVKADIEILFKGNQKKELTQEEKKKKQETKKLQEQALKKAQEKIQEMKIDAHKKALQKLIKDKISQRGFSYMDQNGQIEKLSTDHYTSPVLLMRIVPQFKKFCSNYKVQPKNPDGLLIQQLSRAFKAIDGGDESKFVDPLDWCSSFIAYCADDIDYPYPTYDFNYIIQKILHTVQNAHITEAERKEPNATPSNFGPGNSMFALELNMKKTKITKLDEDDFEAGKEMDRREIRYVLECDLSGGNVESIEQGIRKRFQEKIVWENFYAFDLEYKQKIISIQRPAKYLFVHTNRIGYPPSKDQSEQIILLPTKKSTNKIRTKLILDLSQFCSSSLKQRLQNGKFQRYQLFYRLAQQQQYIKFIDDLRQKCKAQNLNIQTEYTENELHYMYFDSKLFTHDIFHQYYFDQLKGSKQTGEYRLIGVVFHRGQYYHHPDPSHTKANSGHGKNQCRGEFMVMVYKQGLEWLKFYETEVERVDIVEVLSEKYWGGGEWTPALCLYREIYIKNIQIQIPDD